MGSLGAQVTWTNVVISLAMIVAALALISPAARRSIVWRAATTPLASIIGSGFLVLGPLLAYAYGAVAPLIMVALCAVAYAFGGVIRYGMAKTEDGSIAGQRSVQTLDTLSSWALAFAYVVSIAYYLNLFGAFAASMVSDPATDHSEHITLTAFGVVLAIGLARGFDGLEFVEKLAVGLKLVIIAGLLAGLVLYFAEHAPQRHVVLEGATVQGWESLFLAFGLLVTVQGFETSRYLTNTYSTDVAIKSMRLAQIISSAIYITYIALLTYSLKPSERLLSETAIIDMMSVIAPILPGLLLAAALSAQLSAAIADTGGSGGLFSQISNRRISAKAAYCVIAALGAFITLSFDVFEIISYASRAFAAYYGLQAARSFMIARHVNAPRRTILFFAILSVLAAAIALLGTSVET